MSADIETDFEAWASLLAELELLADDGARSRLLARHGVASRWAAADRLWRDQIHQDRRVGEARRMLRLEQLRQLARWRAQSSSPAAGPTEARPPLEPNVALAQTAPAGAVKPALPALPFTGRRPTPMAAHPLEPNPEMGATAPLGGTTRPQPVAPPPVASPPALVATPSPAPRPQPDAPSNALKESPRVIEPPKPPDPAPVQLDRDSARVAASLTDAGADPKAVAALMKAMNPPRLQ